ncbi:MAG: hypothetical protein KBH08_05155, partial [Brachymonas sp.]|nr:hypothetical protein [Brachymonas sp.]
INVAPEGIRYKYRLGKPAKNNSRVTSYRKYALYSQIVTFYGLFRIFPGLLQQIPGYFVGPKEISQTSPQK